MNTKDPNTLTDTELRLWLGKVLGNKCRYCNWCTEWLEIHPEKGQVLKCAYSGLIFESQNVCNKLSTKPIPLTPANAFKWRDWAVEEDEKGYVQALEDMWKYDLSTNRCPVWSFEQWLIHAHPKRYLIAAAKLKENNNGR